MIKRNYLVTGATSGLGFELSKNFIKNAKSLILVSRDKNKLLFLKSILQKINNDVPILIYDIDLSKRNSIKRLIKLFESQKKINYIDVLVNSAANFSVIPIEKITQKNFYHDLQLNLVSPFELSSYFGQKMILNKIKGIIVNIGSSSAYSASPNTSLYCITKHALLGLSRSLNSEWKKYQIRSIFVSPGSMNTKMGQKVLNQDFKTFINVKEAANFINSLLKYNNNMVINEVSLNRMLYK